MFFFSSCEHDVSYPVCFSTDVFILVAVFSVVLLLAFLALSSRYGEDEVPCSDVVYVKTTSTPAHAQNDP